MRPRECKKKKKVSLLIFIEQTSFQQNLWLLGFKLWSQMRIKIASKTAA
jgi:hypothetical protein